MLVPVKIGDLALDQNTNMPIMMLHEKSGSRHLPIWIGAPEAHAIALQKSGDKPARPLTHDLMKTAIEGLGGKLVKAVIHDLKDNTFFAKLFFQVGEQMVEIDSRPSDAVALSLRCDTPVFVESRLLDPDHPEQAKDQSPKDKDTDSLRNDLRNLDPTDFGKFSLE